MKIRLEVEMMPSSNNAWIGKASKRAQIQDYPREKLEWEKYLAALKLQIESQAKRAELDLRLPLLQATIITVYHFRGSGRRDPDNYSGKIIHDSLVATGFLSDDSFVHVDPFPLHRYGSDKERVEIFLIPGLQLRKYAEDLIKA